MNPVCFFDSGVGGLPYLTLARSRLPDERFVYVADAENFPYGEKPADEILASVARSVARIIDALSPKCMVIACNTATVIAIEELRKRFHIPFIGVVPAVKPAAKISVNKKIAVLSTLRTAKDHYLHDLINDFASTCEVSIVPAGDIRDMVEERFFSATPAEKLSLVADTVSELKKQDVDVIVLACTHFLLLEKEFTEVSGNSIQLVDSREGVINQLARVLKEKQMLSEKRSERNQGRSQLYITRNENAVERYRQFAVEFDLDFAGIL